MDGTINMDGQLATRLIRAPRPSLIWKLNNWLRWSKIKSLIGVFVINPIARWFGLMTAYSKLEITHIKANGERVYFGVVDYRVITTAFVNFVVDQLQNETSAFGDFKYHDSGIGTTSPSISDTDIETSDGENRAVGTQTESSPNVYVSVGTITYSTTKAITEHGLFNAATGPTLMDRSTFSAINVVSGDSIQFTYSLTMAAGG